MDGSSVESSQQQVVVARVVVSSSQQHVVVSSLSQGVVLIGGLHVVVVSGFEPQSSVFAETAAFPCCTRCFEQSTSETGLQIFADSSKYKPGAQRLRYA